MQYIYVFFSILENIKKFKKHFHNHFKLSIISVKKFKKYFHNNESPFNCQEIKPVNPKGNQSWIVIRKTDAESEAPILWPPDAKRQLIG